MRANATCAGARRPTRGRTAPRTPAHARARRARRWARRRVRRSARNRAGVMSGRHASVAAATSIGSSGASGSGGLVTARRPEGATPGRGARPSMAEESSRSARVRATRRIRAAPRPVRLRSSMSARHASSASGPSGEQPGHRAGGHVRVLRPRPVGVARALALVRDRDAGGDLAPSSRPARRRARGRRRARAGRSGRGVVRSVAGGTARVGLRCSGSLRRRDRTGTGSCTRRAGTPRGR